MASRTALALLAAPLMLLAAAAAAAPATRPATRPAAAELPAEFNDWGRQYLAMFPKPVDLADPQRVAQHRDEAIPLLRRRLAALTVFVDARPSYKTGWTSYLDEFRAQLLILGDGPTRVALDADARGTGESADRAKRIQLWSRWLLAGRDPAAQSALLPQWQSMADAQPADNELARILITMTGESASPKLADQLVDMLKPMTSIAAQQFALKQAALAKRKQGEGKPMVLAGTTPDGRPFTTADWKGKVILVDFWAVWCGPCKAELPRVKQVYAQYHDQGLEVLGVSNDYGAASLTGYTDKEHLPWPQLFDAPAAAEHKWNPVTTGFGINAIPVMFLIDRKGVCRSVTAREDFEAMIPKLLAE